MYADRRGNFGFVLLTKKGTYELECRVNGRTFVTTFPRTNGSAIKKAEESRLKKGRPLLFGNVPVASRTITLPKSLWTVIDKLPHNASIVIANSFINALFSKSGGKNGKI